METVNSHMTQMGVFLRTFFPHLVDQSEQFDAHENCPGMQAAGLYFDKNMSCTVKNINLLISKRLNGFNNVLVI